MKVDSSLVSICYMVHSTYICTTVAYKLESFLLYCCSRTRGAGGCAVVAWLKLLLCACVLHSRISSLLHTARITSILFHEKMCLFVCLIFRFFGSLAYIHGGLHYYTLCPCMCVSIKCGTSGMLFAQQALVSLK